MSMCLLQPKKENYNNWNKWFGKIIWTQTSWVNVLSQLQTWSKVFYAKNQTIAFTKTTVSDSFCKFWHKSLSCMFGFEIICSSTLTCAFVRKCITEHNKAWTHCVPSNWRNKGKLRISTNHYSSAEHAATQNVWVTACWKHETSTRT